MDRKDWNRIGLTAALLLVPGGFLLGGALAARRYRKGAQQAADQVTNASTAADTDHSTRGD